MNTTRIIRMLCLILLTASVYSCSKDEKEEPKAVATLATSPEAKAAYDNNSGGVIKGVLVGSSGIFKFSLKNGNDSVYCKVTFDGVSGTLTTTELNSWTPGQAISNAHFTGMLGATAVSVSLSSAADGTGISTSFEIANHFVVATPLKETSTLLVKAYEGTYRNSTISNNATTDEGIFNFVVMNNYVYGTRYSSTYKQSRNIKGTVSGNSLNVDGKVFQIDDQTVSASLSDTEEKLVVAGKRTL